MAAAGVGRVRAFYLELLRVKWMALAGVLIVVLRATGALQDNAALLLLYKPALAAIGFITAHIAYQQAFPYIDQEALLRSASRAVDGEERQRNALLFVGTSVLRGFIYAAFILGVTLGL
jgi:hypothetical protein